MFFGRGLYDHCSITEWKWRDSRKKGFSLLPPCLFSLLQVHTCLFPLVSQLFSDFCGSTQHCLGTHTTPVKSRESCKHTWICNIFSDSLWIGRSHFNQDGECLHSSLWKVFFKKKKSSWLPVAPQLSHWWSRDPKAHADHHCRQSLLLPWSQAGTERGQCQQPRNAGWDELCKYILLANGALKYSFTVQLTATRSLPGSSPEYLSSVKLLLFAPKKHYEKIQLSPGN